jgi:hypothetical protein
MDILFGILIFFVLLWYGMKYFLRYGLPWLIARFVRKQQAKQAGYYSASDNSSREGEVHIKKNNSKKPKDDSGFGEYIDYEDIKE